MLENLCFFYLDGPCVVENHLEGTVLKNCVQLEVVGAKDCLNMIEASLSKTSFWQDENNPFTDSMTLLIQFEVWKTE